MPNERVLAGNKEPDRLYQKGAKEMKNLTDTAQNLLDRYLTQVRTHLSACTDVDADEVEQNVMGHIENELAGAQTPVGFDEVDAVLKRLGSPRQWIPEEELPWWRKTISRLRTGPDDWRLAYISFGVFVLAFFAGRLGFLVLLLLSFVLARAAVSEANSRQEELGAQKWLIYPPLLSMYVTSSLLILLWPWFYIAPRLVCLLQASDVTYALSSQPESLLLGGFITSIYWIIIGVVFLIRPKWLSFLLRPFADKFSRTFARLVLLFGSGIALAFAILFIWWQYA